MIIGIKPRAARKVLIPACINNLKKMAENELKG